MGIRINVLLDHNLECWDDPQKVIRRLEPSLNSLLAVRDYWMRNDPTPNMSEAWMQKPTGFSFKCTNLEGPGHIFAHVTEQVLQVHTGGRWSGFMTTPELRTVHLAAFRSIARCVGASFAAYFADCDDVWDIFHENQPPERISGILARHYGQPRSDIDSVVEEAAQRRPTVWYYERFIPAEK